MTDQIIHKRGSSWSYSVVCTNDDGTPFDLTNVTIKAQIRDLNHNLVEELATNKTDAAAGQWTITPVDTADWPIKSLRHDVLYTLNGIKVHSETIVIKVVQAETEA